MNNICNVRKNSVIFIISVFSLGVLIYYLHLIHGFSNTNYYWDSNLPRYQWRPEYSTLNGPDVLPNDPRLLSKLSKYSITLGGGKYNLENVSLDYDPSMGQSQIIRKLFKEKKDGFFVECGALDGETRSNTLYLERYLKWSGLLIEGDPLNYDKLKEKDRKVYSSNTCLSTKAYPTMVSFEQRSNQGKISQSFTAGYLEKGFVDVQCYPFATYMHYLNRTTVDYFSLDVEGLELEILKTIDFNRFDIKSLSVEFIHDAEGKDAIEEFMKLKGYFVLGLVTHPNWLANDFIFVKRDFAVQMKEDEMSVKQRVMT